MIREVKVKTPLAGGVSNAMVSKKSSHGVCLNAIETFNGARLLRRNVLCANKSETSHKQRGGGSIRAIHRARKLLSFLVRLSGWEARKDQIYAG
jgi:predicted transposase YbfD/YdcC